MSIEKTQQVLCMQAPEPKPLHQVTILDDTARLRSSWRLSDSVSARINDFRTNDAAFEPTQLVRVFEPTQALLIGKSEKAFTDQKVQIIKDQIAPTLPIHPQKQIETAQKSFEDSRERARRNIADLAIADCHELTDEGEEEDPLDQDSKSFNQSQLEVVAQQTMPLPEPVSVTAQPTGLIMIDTTDKKVGKLGLLLKPEVHYPTFVEADASQAEDECLTNRIEEASLINLLSEVDPDEQFEEEKLGEVKQGAGPTSFALAESLAQEESARDYALRLQERATMALIQQLQEEEERAAEERRKKREAEGLEQFTCKICLEGFEEALAADFSESKADEIMPLSLCEHVFHKACLVGYLKSRIEEAKVLMLCPEVTCKLEIGDLDLRELLSETEHAKYASFALNAVIDTQKEFSWCPTPDCKFAFIYEAVADAQARDELNCPLCKKHYCLRCKVAYHDGISCEAFQLTHDAKKLDDAFYAFAEGKKFKQCPHCAFWVERSEGCDHMSCRCGKSFCYKCGGIYGACECRRLQMQEHLRQQEARRARLREQARVRRERQREQRAREWKRLAKVLMQEVGVIGRTRSQTKALIEAQKSKEKTRHKRGSEQDAAVAEVVKQSAKPVTRASKKVADKSKVKVGVKRPRV